MSYFLNTQKIKNSNCYIIWKQGQKLSIRTQVKVIIWSKDLKIIKNHMWWCDLLECIFLHEAKEWGREGYRERVRYREGKRERDGEMESERGKVA